MNPGCSVVLPGGNDFEDVTALFEVVSQDMQPGSLIFDKDFTLHNAMAAFEIGKPLFDSGLVLLDEHKPVFNPLTPLLPDEVCWIIDRALACEMEWHTGYTLPQTVFSFIYVHALNEIDPDHILPSHFRKDKLRPIELITVVLRASVLGLLKCCDLSWGELDRGNLHDTEDWHSEKCDVPISERYPISYILGLLDEACVWLRNSPKVRSSWRDSLLHRLALRKTLIELLAAQTSKEYIHFRPLVDTARQLLRKVRQTSPPWPGQLSPARRAFDAEYPRVLVSQIPLHIIELPEQDEAWNKLTGLLDSLEQLSLLVDTPDLSVWNAVGTLQNWAPKAYQRLPYIRSAFQTAIYDSGMVLNQYTQKHVLDCFFMEGLQISYDSFIDSFQKRWLGPSSSPLAHIERTIAESMIGLSKSHWYNPARRRRYCMKSLYDWHDLYALLVDIQKHLSPVSGVDIIARLLHVVLAHRYQIICEVILSGFQLSLYSVNERPFAYWYLAQVLELYLSCLDTLVAGHSNKDSFSRIEFEFRARWLTALQAVSSALFCVTLKTMGSSWQRLRLNFLRRFKWAFIHEYEDIDLPPIGHPDFLLFTSTCAEIWQDKETSPARQIELAHKLLGELRIVSGGMPKPWSEDRMRFVESTMRICWDLRGLPEAMADVQVWDATQLEWDPDVHPWLPLVRSVTSPQQVT